MKSRRVLARAAAAAALIPIAAVGFAPPAAAIPVEQLTTRISTLDIAPEIKLTAATFPTKGCDGVPDGAKKGSDAWVFGNPAGARRPTGYLFKLIDPKRPEHQREVPVVIVEEGAYGARITTVITDPVPEAPETKAGSKDPAKMTTDPRPGPTPDRRIVFRSPTDNPNRRVSIIAVPEGVSGGLTETGGWLRVPAGWEITYGEYQDHPAKGADANKFPVVRVCVPPADPAPVPAQPAPSLPVTGARTAAVAGTGIVLVLVGGALFFVWRRRTVRFTV
jgi:LPXTG-motif cell wall-anchored protein